jgi:hypothetical protein
MPGPERLPEKRDYLGFRTRPMGWDDVAAKFERLTAGRAPDGLVEAVTGLEEVPVTELCTLLERVARPRDDGGARFRLLADQRA